MTEMFQRHKMSQQNMIEMFQRKKTDVTMRPPGCGSETC